MNWDEIKQRKEDSIRESLKNPKTDSIQINNVEYKTFTEYINSDEYKEYMETIDQAKVTFEKESKDFYESLSYENKVKAIFHVVNMIYKNEYELNGTYRKLIYDLFGLDPDSYGILMDCGLLLIHNDLITVQTRDDNFEKLQRYLDLNLTQEQKEACKNILNFGFDHSYLARNANIKQKSFDFEKDPE